MDIKFKTGDFVHYIARRPFSLGNTGLTISEASDVWYDGTTAIVGPSLEDGDKYTVPTLRGAVKAGWLISAEQYWEGDTQAPAPQSANVQVRSAIGGSANPMSGMPQRSFITTVNSDERVVMDSTKHAAATAEHNKRPRGAAPNTQVISAGQAATVVGRTFKTAAKQNVELNGNNVGSHIYDAEHVKIEAGEGRTREELLSGMTEEQREAYLSKLEEKRVAHLIEAGLNPDTPRNPAPSRPRVTVKTSNTEGINFSVTTGGGTEVADVGDLPDAKKVVSEHYVEGIKVTNTNGPKRDNLAVQPQAKQASAPVRAVQAVVQARISKDGTGDPRKRLAKKICADFPEDYNFSDHWKRRLAMIRLNYEDRADVIQAIFMAESDDFKTVLLEEFPEVFAQV